MASSVKYPRIGESLSSGVAWTTPENIVSDNVSYAYRSSSGNSAQLTGTDFGFSIPSTATINGIVLEIEAHDTQPASGAVFNTVQLKKSSGAVGSNLAASTTFPDTLTVVSFGTSTELWGTTWTPDEINDPAFGAYMIATKPDTSGDHYIDFLRITVYYTVGSSPANFPAIMDATLDANAATSNQGTGNFTVGEYGFDAQVNRALIKFDLSALTGKTIASATLKLYDTGADYSSASGTIEVYRAKRVWTELGTTWNKYDGTNDWGTAGCANTTSDREATAIGTSASIDATETLGEEYSITLSASAIQEIVDGTFTNNGFLLKTTSETNDMHSICGRNHATAAYRSVLVVTYSEPTTTSTSTSTSTTTSTTSTSTTITVTSTTISTSTTTSTSSSTSTTTTTLLLDFIPKMERISFRLVQ